MAILDKIRRSAELQDLFFDLCDFELSDEEAPEWLKVANGFLVRPIGRDGAGGVFLDLTPAGGSDSMVVYCSSEGQAGSLGASEEEFFSVMASVPHWRDCLKFSAGGSLEEMRRCGPMLENDYRENVENYDRKRNRLLKLLGLPLLSDPLRSMHAAVSRTPSGVFLAPDGNTFTSLFNIHRWQGGPNLE